jgi:hypothetical protein
MKKYKKSELESMTLEQMNNILSESNWDVIFSLNNENLNTRFLNDSVSIAKSFLNYSGDVYNPEYFNFNDSGNLTLFKNEIDAKIFALEQCEDLLESSDRLEE